jgi:hypothetical protein
MSRKGALKAIIARMDEVMSQLEDSGRNYYGTAMDTAILEGEWLERACRLFDLPLPEAESATATPAPATPAPAKKPANYKHTRRVHGRRALTPPRSGRGTAFTRHKPRVA